MDPETRRFAGVPHRPGVRIQNSFTTADLGQDLVNAGGPDEEFRAAIVSLQGIHGSRASDRVRSQSGRDESAFG